MPGAARFAGWLVGLVIHAIVFATTDPIKVGELASLTGTEAGLGQQAAQGLHAGRRRSSTPAAACSGGPLELMVEDIHSKAGDSATATRKLVARDKVVAVLCGGTSSNTLEAAPICQVAQVPLLASVSTQSASDGKGDVCFPRVLRRFVSR